MRVGHKIGAKVYTNPRVVWAKKNSGKRGKEVKVEDREVYKKSEFNEVYQGFEKRYTNSYGEVVYGKAIGALMLYVKTRERGNMIVVVGRETSLWGTTHGSAAVKTATKSEAIKQASPKGGDK